MFIKLILIILLIYALCASRSEGFYSDAEIQNKTNAIINNRELFGNNKKYITAKKKLNWLDPILFEDTVKLSENNNFTSDSLKKIFT